MDDDRPEPRFIVDVMLGRLATWLRLLGYDVLYDARTDDREIARISVREQRVVLTRDRGLLARRMVRQGLLVEHDELGAQLRQVVHAFGLSADARRMFSRCTTCNSPVEPVPKSAIEGLVPPFVYRSHEEFLRCPGCARIYWGGSHRLLARRRLFELLGS